MTIEQKYLEKCKTPSDINELLPYLKLYADHCEHVTEMGTRNCVSIYAFLASKAKKIVAYDIEKQPEVDECIAICNNEKRNFTFIEANVLEVEIEETDALFIDTFHTYSQLRSELAKHSKKVRKYIAMHDVSTYGQIGERAYLKQGHDGMNDGRGLIDAINEFASANPQWTLSMKTNKNNGLCVLEKN